jgi:hypothetical protein
MLVNGCLLKRITFINDNMHLHNDFQHLNEIIFVSVYINTYFYVYSRNSTSFICHKESIN